MTVLWRRRRRRSKVHSSLVFVLLCIAKRIFFHSLGIEYRDNTIIIIIIIIRGTYHIPISVQSTHVT